jgi:tetratricopeptide (TPR) repeat protein
MGSKEVMGIAPIVVLLYDRCFLAGSFRDALRRRWPLYVGLASTWAVLGAMLIVYPWGGKTGAGFGLGDVSPWQYARTQPGVILHYLGLSFWPRSLCLDYGWPVAMSAREILPAAVAVAALLAGTVWALRRAPTLGFLGAWFFLILAPSSSLVPIIKEIAAERRMYLPLAAVVTGCVAAAWGLGKGLICGLTESDGARRVVGSALAIAALAATCAELGYRTFERNATYRTAISIWEDTAEKRPRNPGAQVSLGAAYLQAGRADEAIQCFSRAIELKPDLADAYNDRGAAHTVNGHEAEALRDFEQALKLDPRSAAAYGGRAAAYIHLQRYDLALADCREALALQPDLAYVYNTRGVAYANTGRVAEAIQDYTRALALDPDFAEAYNNRGHSEAVAGRLDEAIQDCSQAIELDPGCVEALENRSLAYLQAGRYALAIADCDRAIQLRPDRRQSYLNRAGACSQIGQYEQALADVKRFREMGGRPPPEFVEALLRAAGQSQ